MAHSLQSFIEESGKHLDFLQAQALQYEELLNENEENLINLKAQYKDVLLQIVQIVAPTFSAKELTSLAKLMNRQSIADLPAKIKEEQHKLRTRLQEIKEDPEFQQREVLTNKTNGTYIQEYNQLNSAYKNITKEFDLSSRQTHVLNDLIVQKYGTQEYKHRGFMRFFNSKHLRNWKKADILVEQLGFNTFQELRDSFREHLQKGKEIEEAIVYYKTKIDRIEAMEVEEKGIEERLPNLIPLYKERLAINLQQFFESTAPYSYATFFQNYASLTELKKIQEGLSAQQEYLEEFQGKLRIEADALTAKQQRLSIERGRYTSNPSKYRGRTWTEEKFEKRFNRNHEWIEKRYNKYKKTGHTISSFRDYDRAPDAVEAFLWWELITENQRIDSSFSSSVSDFYSSHPHYEQDYAPEPIDTPSYSDAS